MRSKFESRVASLLKKLKVVFTYETETLPYTVTKQKTYKPDFIVTCPKSGKKIYIETKGLFTSTDRTKMLYIKEQYPRLDIRLWFQKNNYLTKNKKSRYSDWAERHGFKYHIGEEFPKHWF